MGVGQAAGPNTSVEYATNLNVFASTAGGAKTFKSSPGSILSFSKIFRSNLNFLMSWRFIESSALFGVCGQCMKRLIGDQTHLVLASGKLVLQ